MLTVDLVGIMYFDACSELAKRVLLPNGTQAGDGLPPHYASLWVEANRYESDDWWPDQKFVHAARVVGPDDKPNKEFVLEFRIPVTSSVLFPDEEDSAADNSALDGKLPKLQDMGFELDTVAPDAIAHLPIRGGVLTPFKLGSSGVVRWQITKHPDRITITARPDQAGEKDRTITLRSFKGVMENPTDALNDMGIEIVFANTPELIGADGVPATAAHAAHLLGDQPPANPVPPGEDAPADHHDHDQDHVHGDHNHDHPPAPEPVHHSHFVLYGKLDKDRKTANLANPKLHVDADALDFDHVLLRCLAFTEHTPDPECSGSCC
jgi:hypothetical protein